MTKTKIDSVPDKTITDKFRKKRNYWKECKKKYI